MYGNRVAATTYTPFRSVIGEIAKTPSGNIALRIGREHEGGWEQTEHVVMLRNETADFVRQVTEVLDPRSTKDTFTLRLDRALAAELLANVVNGPRRDPSEHFAQVWERLADFVNDDKEDPA